MLDLYRQVLAGTDPVHAASKMWRTEPADFSNRFVRATASMVDSHTAADNNVCNGYVVANDKLLHHLRRLCKRMRPDVWRMFVSGFIFLLLLYGIKK